MPRDSSGTYSLPAGNPVTTLSVVSSTWANTTLSDISTALTASLDRSGQGAMLAGLKLFDGAIGTPGLTWGTETTAGLYRAGAGDFRFAIGGVDVWQLAASGPISSVVTASGGSPEFVWIETDAAANNRRWDVIVEAEQLKFRLANDANNSFTNWLVINRTLNVVDSVDFPTQVSFTSTGLAAGTLFSSVAPAQLWYETGAAANNGKWYSRVAAEVFEYGAVNDAITVATAYLQVNRTGTTIDTVNFPNGILQYGGIEVGYKQMDFVNFAVSTAVTNANRSKLYRATASGTTLTFDTTLTAGALYTVSNENAAAITIAGSGVTLNWFAGTGAAPAVGSRTLAGGGLATVYMLTTTAAFVWGVGLS